MQGAYATMPFEAIQAGEERGPPVRQLAGHAADHRPPGAEQADQPVAEELLLRLGQVLADRLEKPAQVRRYGFHQGLRSHHAAPPCAVTSYGVHDQFHTS